MGLQALSSLELMGSRQRKNFLKLFRKYIKHKKDVIDWCVRSDSYSCSVAALCLPRKP